jgi:hypothetical protein
MGSVKGHPQTENQKKFMRENADSYYGGKEIVKRVIELLNSRKRENLHEALGLLCGMFFVKCELTFSDCKEKPVSKVYPPFRTGYANAIRINICTDVLEDNFNSIHSKQIIFDDPECYEKISHLAIVFLHEFGHVMHKNHREGPYGDTNDEERTADNWAVCFINYYLKF